MLKHDWLFYDSFHVSFSNIMLLLPLVEFVSWLHVGQPIINNHVVFIHFLLSLVPLLAFGKICGFKLVFHFHVLGHWPDVGHVTLELFQLDYLAQFLFLLAESIFFDEMWTFWSLHDVGSSAKLFRISQTVMEQVYL